MFKLFYKPIQKVVTIYDITKDKSGFPHFLIYTNGAWITKSAKYFVPVENIPRIKTCRSQYDVLEEYHLEHSPIINTITVEVSSGGLKKNITNLFDILPNNIIRIKDNETYKALNFVYDYVNITYVYEE